MPSQNIHVVVYQMGKVASQSICSGVEQLGIPVWQCHFLGRDRFIAIIDQVLQPWQNEYVVRTNSSQLRDNLLVMNLIERYKARSFDTQKVKIISPCRDPIDWFFSSFIQNYEGDFPSLRTWCLDNGIDCQNDVEIIQKSFSHLFKKVVETSLSVADPRLPKAISACGAGHEADALVQMTYRLRTPHVWYDEHLKKTFDIDLYDFTQNQKSFSRFSYNDYADVLSFRYEDVERICPDIASFLGVEEFTLPIKNITEEKQVNRTVMTAVKSMSLPDEFLNNVYSTRYCKYFGYDRQNSKWVSAMNG